MDGNDRLSVFLSTLREPLPEELSRIEEKARERDIPVIRRETQDLLRLVIEMKRPKRILEIGTAVGFSGSFMLLYAPADAVLTTFEIDEENAREAEENFRALSFSERVTLKITDAAEGMKALSEPFDLVFIDAAKGQYPRYYEEAVRLTKEGSIIFTDNCLLDSTTIESRYFVKRRDRTMHARMRDFLYEICHDERFYSDVLSAGDGTVISVRIK